MDIPHKVRTLAEIGCNACEVVKNDDGTFPLYVASKPIQLPPWTRQSIPKQNTIIVEAMRQQLHKYSVKPWNGPTCITIAAIEPRTAKMKIKDVDNLVKGLLDGLEGILYTDDKLVQCLTSRRFEYSGSTGYYLVSARAVRPWENDVVYDNPHDPIILSGKVVLPENGGE
jgi:hypothetical protein